MPRDVSSHHFHGSQSHHEIQITNQAQKEKNQISSSLEKKKCLYIPEELQSIFGLKCQVIGKILKLILRVIVQDTHLESRFP